MEINTSLEQNLSNMAFVLYKYALLVNQYNQVY